MSVSFELKVIAVGFCSYYLGIKVDRGTFSSEMTAIREWCNIIKEIKLG
jgi:hypothetical protein